MPTKTKRKIARCLKSIAFEKPPIENHLWYPCPIFLNGRTDDKWCIIFLRRHSQISERNAREKINNNGKENAEGKENQKETYDKANKQMFKLKREMC